MTKSILMIHGVGCGGDVWDRMRAPFEAAGWRVDAPTLFADQRTVDIPPASLSQLRLADYIASAAQMARKIESKTGARPVVIGHSMGGLIAQHLAAQGDASAAIFLTPAQTPDCQIRDPRLFITFWNILKHGPKKMPQGSYKVGRFGFGWGVLNCVDKSRHDEIYKSARHDSGRVYLDLSGSGPIDEAAVTIPTLTIGAARDRATPVKAVRKVGEKYSKAGKAGDYLEYPDNAHWIVDEPGTDRVTADILEWLAKAPALT